MKKVMVLVVVMLSAGYFFYQDSNEVDTSTSKPVVTKVAPGDPAEGNVIKSKLETESSSSVGQDALVGNLESTVDEVILMDYSQREQNSEIDALTEMYDALIDEESIGAEYESISANYNTAKNNPSARDKKNSDRFNDFFNQDGFRNSTQDKGLYVSLDGCGSGTCKVILQNVTNADFTNMNDRTEAENILMSGLFENRVIDGAIETFSEVNSDGNINYFLKLL